MCKGKASGLVRGLYVEHRAALRVGVPSCVTGMGVEAFLSNVKNLFPHYSRAARANSDVKEVLATLSQYCSAMLHKVCRSYSPKSVIENHRRSIT